MVRLAKRWAISLRVSGICPAGAGARRDSRAAAMVRTAPRLYTAETGPGTGHQLIEHPHPADGVYAVASRHQKIITCGGRPVSSTGTPKI